MIEIPGIGYLFRKLEELGRWLSELQKRRALDRAVGAWRSIDFLKLFDSLTEYYKSKGVPVFFYSSANGESTAVPLYVRPYWLDLTEDSLHMAHIAAERPVVLPKAQRRFRDLYPEVRAKLGLEPMWDGRLFRLIELHSAEPKLSLRFEEGRFLEALEARLALAKAKSSAVRPQDLPIRESLTSTSEAIERFCQTQVVRVGISNLLLFRCSEKAYRPAIRARGAQSMGQVGNYDPMSSGIFDISTQDPKIDFSLKYKVFKEVYEELFGGKEVEREISGLDPDFFFDRPGVADLRAMLDDGRASFRVTGFCIDLVRIVPEITTVLVVRDESYYREHRGRMRANLEYGPAFYCEIPRDIPDVDEYLTTKFPSDPGRPDAGQGFDPLRWTLPGGFCFRQGLKRAARDNLL